MRKNTLKVLAGAAVLSLALYGCQNTENKASSAVAEVSSVAAEASSAAVEASSALDAAVESVGSLAAEAGATLDAGALESAAAEASSAIDAAAGSVSAAAEGVQFTLEELAKYNGKDGAKAYVAVDGIVYDVTDAEAWANGGHNGFTAGEDLTEAIKEAPHGKGILSKLPVVGVLVQ